METKYLTTQGWLDYLQSMPEELWITDHFTAICDGKECHCAAGFINDKNGDYIGEDYELTSDIYNKARTFLPDSKGEYTDTIVRVNDGKEPKYQQPTPKQRVIALLTDMIVAGY